MLEWLEGQLALIDDIREESDKAGFTEAADPKADIVGAAREAFDTCADIRETLEKRGALVNDGDLLASVLELCERPEAPAPLQYDL